MRITKALLMFAFGLLVLATQAVQAQDKPYKEGTVWSISFIKVKPGMFDVYLRDLAVQRKLLMDEAKKQGLIVSEKMLSGSASGRDDWDLMLMVEYKNWAAFDGLSAKFDALALNDVLATAYQLDYRERKVGKMIGVSGTAFCQKGGERWLVGDQQAAVRGQFLRVSRHAEALQVGGGGNDDTPHVGDFLAHQRAIA